MTVPQDMAAEFDPVIEALKQISQRWQDPVMMAGMLSYFEAKEFKHIQAKSEKDNVSNSIADVLKMLRLIQVRVVDRRLEISTRGKMFLKYLIETKLLTPMHGAEFIMAYGRHFGRRLMFDIVFIPDLGK